MRAPATIDASSLAIASDASASAVTSVQAGRPGQLRASGRAFAQISQFHPELTAFRRDLHAHPELGFEEVYTSSRVAHALKLCGVDEVHTGIAKTGVVAVIKGQQTGTAFTSGARPMVGLRADMDALPMTEHNEFGWKSSKTGLMHGCGHDGHTTMLVGAARYLAETRHFAGDAVLVFQPAEEGRGGAEAMIQAGLFERFPVQSIYAMHNWPSMRPGTIGINPGPMMAAADRVTIEIAGKGGHGAHAYLTVDPVLVAAHIITAVQSIVSRNVKAMDSAVISLCAMHAGDPGAMSVVAGSATLVGTVRTFRPDVQNLVERRLQDLCTSVAQGFGATATVTYERIYPATINSPAEYTLATAVADQLVGPENVVRDLEPSMGSEDFSFMLQVKPGAYLRLGQGEQLPDGKGASIGGVGSRFLHNSCYDFNDSVLPLGSALFAGIVERSLPLKPQAV
ncbi:M20 aminoacylase family protein [Polaromonas sp. JS666]|uniref:M20 aminoacylase family protein n=1 Tax=Polaromonas sp. (strain JS666 / ATCC BAA-500) TaxID=296591 RepID=UPI0000464E4E|nr:M20 aminoacylase family protein [Polaromonas sp. JS666]